MDDAELLRRYIQGDDEVAFRQLVERHKGLVYSVALRQLGNPHQAEEVTCAVFSVLATKAAALSPTIVLPGWLFRATRYAASNLQRDEGRRRAREQQGALLMSNDSNAAEGLNPDQEKILPILDQELECLRQLDRDAVLLRFYEKRSFREIGEDLGTSEDAAKMRVNRVLEKLRKRFLRRGVAFSATLLTTFHTSRICEASPLASDLTARIANGLFSHSKKFGLADAIARQLVWWKWKSTILATLLAVTVGIAGLTALSLFKSRWTLKQDTARPLVEVPHR